MTKDNEGDKDLKPMEPFHINIPQSQTPTFANSVQINVTNEEVILQFVYMRPATKQGTLVSEIALTPQHAIRLQKSLNETIKKHFTPDI